MKTEFLKKKIEKKTSILWGWIVKYEPNWSHQVSSYLLPLQLAKRTNCLCQKTPCLVALATPFFHICKQFLN